MSLSTKLCAIVAAACWIASALLILGNTPGDDPPDTIRAAHQAATLLLAAGGVLAAIAGLDARRTWRMDDARLARIRAEALGIGLRTGTRIADAQASAPEMSETPPRGIRRG